ncbi:hypothetical protein CUU62_16690 [Pseudomonas sp. WP001]|nr:hypothetical protein CUU62_16690 [Pseudomonas sp. WP001]
MADHGSLIQPSTQKPESQLEQLLQHASPNFVTTSIVFCAHSASRTGYQYLCNHSSMVGNVGLPVGLALVVVTQHETFQQLQRIYGGKPGAMIHLD